MTPTVEEIIARAIFDVSQIGNISIERWEFEDIGPAGLCHRQQKAVIAALDAAGFVITPKAETQVLLDWIELWDKVCEAADPDDDQEPPPWSEVVKQVLPDWNADHVTSAEYWSGYQQATLIYAIRDFRSAMLESRPQSPSGGER